MNDNPKRTAVILIVVATIILYAMWSTLNTIYPNVGEYISDKMIDGFYNMINIFIVMWQNIKKAV